MFGSIQLCARVRARLRVLDDRKMEFENDFSLKEWAKDKPLSILQLDPADRAVLRIAGLFYFLTMWVAIKKPGKTMPVNCLHVDYIAALFFVVIGSRYRAR